MESTAQIIQAIRDNRNKTGSRNDMIIIPPFIASSAVKAMVFKSYNVRPSTSSVATEYSGGKCCEVNGKCCHVNGFKVITRIGQNQLMPSSRRSNLRRDYIFSDAEYQASNSRLAKL